MNDSRGRRGLGLALLGVLFVVALAWATLGRGWSPAAVMPSGDPTNGVTITNGIDSATVTIVYERPDAGTEKLVDLGPGQHAVIDTIFAAREGLCRTGRLVALAADGAELDELYLVCRGRSWTVTLP